MPKERDEERRLAALPRRNPPQPIRRLSATVDMSDPVQAAAWWREWGQAWRRRQAAESGDDAAADDV
jgi:hypothetical protein